MQAFHHRAWQLNLNEGLMIELCALYAAPTAAPTEVRVLTYNSTSISLSWEKPPFSDRNGEIVQYHIQVVEQETDTYLQYSTQYQQYILVSLHPYYNYNISIAAETIEVGPFSTVIHLQTLESGNSSHFTEFAISCMYM